MPDAGTLEDFLAGACVDAAVFALRPDYRAMLVAVDGLVPGPGDRDSDALLQAAETAAREALRSGPTKDRADLTDPGRAGRDAELAVTITFPKTVRAFRHLNQELFGAGEAIARSNRFPRPRPQAGSVEATHAWPAPVSNALTRT